jgi:omega-6 fatty acid desaturase (delta-12 desaturase)
MNEKNVTRVEEFAGWQKVIKKYQTPDVSRGTWQMINSFGGLFAGWVLMYVALQFVGIWLALLLAVPTAGFLVRIFIIQHDCGHGSFMKSKKANDRIGAISGVFTLTPYKLWRRSHAIHHAHHADLDDRGTGDIWTLTVEEYLDAPTWEKIAYRVFRNPFFLFGLAPIFQFIILSRFHFGMGSERNKKNNTSLIATNLGLFLLLFLPSLVIGFQAVLILWLPVAIIASSAGTWMFYVQHQFEDTYWEHKPEWDYTLAAMAGSSYYELPKLLQWFTGNIGFHHIHHLSPRIPNYNLQACHEENEIMQQVVKLTLWSSLETSFLALWDEGSRTLITFRQAVQLQS